MARADTPVSLRWRRPLRPRSARDGRGAPAPTTEFEAASSSSAAPAAPAAPAAIRRRRPVSEYRSWAPVRAAAVGTAASAGVSRTEASEAIEDMLIVDDDAEIASG